MKERPILFSAPMVRAILEGRKTQTRRVVKPQPVFREDTSPPGWQFQPGKSSGEGGLYKFTNYSKFVASMSRFCPYGQPGDRLWVRETWAYHVQAIGAATDADGPFVYRATDGTQHRLCDKWRPSIHMPRWASRILLEVTGVHVERLQDINRGDSMAEGCPFQNMADGDDPRQWYSELWNTINGSGSWDANPWVWVVEFKRLKGGAA